MAIKLLFLSVSKQVVTDLENQNSRNIIDKLRIYFAWLPVYCVSAVIFKIWEQSCDVQQLYNLIYNVRTESEEHYRSSEYCSYATKEGEKSPQVGKILPKSMF